MLLCLKHAGCGGSLVLEAVDEDFYYFRCAKCSRPVRYTARYISRFLLEFPDDSLIPVQVHCQGCGQERVVRFVDPRKSDTFSYSCTNCGPLHLNRQTGLFEPYDP